MSESTIVPKINHKTFHKRATFLNRSSTDRKWLADQGPGFYVIEVIDVWGDKEELRRNIEGRVKSRPKMKIKTKKLGATE